MIFSFNSSLNLKIDRTDIATPFSRLGAVYFLDGRRNKRYFTRSIFGFSSKENWVFVKSEWEYLK